ncbi:MAG: type VII secretion protein EccB, partial [Cellulomonadaceae bacterium]|nr:type VII secretion protein EccB [Cellulomonadaceae bacterium]
VVVGATFYGLLKPGLPDDWQNNRLIVAKDTGARYVSSAGVLRPVVNVTSARLLIPSADYAVITSSSADLADLPLGSAVGIAGAPDQLPPGSDLIGSGWAACVGDDATTSVVLAAAAPAERSDGAVVVRGSAGLVVVAGENRYPVDERGPDAVLRALGLDTRAIQDVDDRWLNVFDPGTTLAPIIVRDAGTPLATTSLLVGQALHPNGSPADERYLLQADGSLAPLSPVAYSLYMLGTGSQLGPAVDVAPGDIAGLSNAGALAGGADWPTTTLTSLDDDATVCALSADDGNQTWSELATIARPGTEALPYVSVEAGHGALVRAVGRGEAAASELYLVDATGTAFPVTDDAETVARLGYAEDEIGLVPAAWIALLPVGPGLSAEAAAQSPATQAAAMSTDADAACTGTDALWIDQQPTALAMLQPDRAWAVTQGAGVLVAVVDSGVDASNEHLGDALAGGVDLVGDGLGANGYADSFGHGTALAGIIAGRQVDGSGVVGLAPQAKVLSVRVLADDTDDAAEAGFGPSTARTAAGIDQAVAAGAQVVVVAMSTTTDDPELRAAVAAAADAGALVVASAGNVSTSQEDAPDAARYPAAYPDALGVAAVGTDRAASDNSVHGAHVDVAAPGQEVLTAAAQGKDCVYGTDAAQSSFATAYVGAAAALVASAHPDETPAQWAFRLTATATRPNPDQRDDAIGWGVVQPFEAIALLPGPTVRGPVNPWSGSAAPAGGPVADPLVLSPSTSVWSGTRAVSTVAAVLVLAVIAITGPVLASRRRRDTEAPTVRLPQGATGRGLLPETGVDP